MISVRVAPSVPSSVTAIDRPVFSDKLAALPAKLQSLAALQGFDGKEGQTLVVTAGNGQSIEVLVGLGAKDKLTVNSFRLGAAAYSKVVAKHENVATNLFKAKSRLNAEKVLAAIVEGVQLARYEFWAHKSEASKSVATKVAVVTSYDSAKKVVKRATKIVEAVNLARDLGNEPGGTLLPVEFVKRAEAVAEANDLKVTVWDQKRIVKEKLGGLLAVNQGSEHEARFLTLAYKPAKPVASIALVGKGITFDSGGLSIKSSQGMMTMKIDMGGGAAVLAAMSALKAVDAPVAVTGYIPLTDNMTGGAAIRPGDVFIARNGKSVEVLNTDAEGRLVMADALSIAAETKPDAIIDVATLTGASAVAVGGKFVAVMGSAQDVVDRILSAGDDVDENMWQLPLPKEYRSELDSPVADLKNIGSGRYAGASVAGLFLQEFTDGLPWAHLDLGLAAFSESASPLGPKGATGLAVRTIIETLASWK